MHWTQLTVPGDYILRSNRYPQDETLLGPFDNIEGALEKWNYQLGYPGNLHVVSITATDILCTRSIPHDEKSRNNTV